MNKREIASAFLVGAVIAAGLMWLGWHSESDPRDTISFWAQSPGLFTAGRVVRFVRLPIFDYVAVVVNTLVYALIGLLGMKVRHSVAR